MPELYDKDTLDRVKACELEILKDFARVCDENGLSYFGFGGTGIGALRHGGFIPWDDDIDLGIPREDYKKAMEIFERDYADKYTVVNAQKFDFPVMNTHIIIKDSKFITEEDKYGNYPKGIFLDIFPLDNTPDDEDLRKKHLRKTWLLSKLFVIKHIPFPHVPFKGFMRKLAHCVTATMWFFLKLVSHKFLYNLCLKECIKYNSTETGHIAYCCGSKFCGNVFNKEQLYPLRKEKFEDTEIFFPGNLEDILTAEYGDFMQVPPPEKRINHSPKILEFPKDKKT